MSPPSQRPNLCQWTKERPRPCRTCLKVALLHHRNPRDCSDHGSKMSCHSKTTKQSHHTRHYIIMWDANDTFKYILELFKILRQTQHRNESAWWDWNCLKVALLHHRNPGDCSDHVSKMSCHSWKTITPHDTTKRHQLSKQSISVNHVNSDVKKKNLSMNHLDKSNLEEKPRRDLQGTASLINKPRQDLQGTASLWNTNNI